MNRITGKSANELAEARTELAAQRTLMAADRSLMAWIRTGLAMISFGFTIYRVLDGFRAEGASLNHSPRSVGLFLIGLGMASVLMGTYEYWDTLHDLRSYQKIRVWRASFTMALLISVMGLIMFVGTATNLF